ncbi:DNA-binding protein SMUBP-2 [Drosophila sulfurigaster albostrigata]|uniref:DNA-binding protein SMUBP-2 n=1 Tax=Drosophila albomicans TaxID=7291 RepID=A0A6P8YY59_DROAB|nr:DNA-binding protein SMUBP-2 [Drosophila albomicans]XP_060660689.1 DNA-binding protein SMUBP-2 [Drosophila nasuta]XP_062136223.1 DNA-binding protein SMUBP-2 [Drosophila sulfurigaster albostrigata]
MEDKSKPTDAPSCSADSEPLFPPAKPGKAANYGTNNTLELLERIPSQIVDLKLDEVLTAVKTVDNLCDFARCKAKTSLMGQDCELCKKRFCFKHGLPEVHGCGMEKKREARKEFLNPKPIKTIRHEEELKNAKKKLNEKLKNMQVGRMQKTGATDGKKKKK